MENNKSLFDDNTVVFYVANRADVQSFVKANFGRELTEKEIKRIGQEFIFGEETFDLLMTATHIAAEEAMDSADGRWDIFDAEQESIAAKKT